MSTISAVGTNTSVVKSSGLPWTIFDPVLGLMKILLDVDGKPVKDVDGKYIYVKVE